MKIYAEEDCRAYEYTAVPDVEPPDKEKAPEHYTTGAIEAWDYMKDNMPREAYLGGLEWNTKKYLHRWRYKGNPLSDLKKARVYLDRLISEMETEK